MTAELRRLPFVVRPLPDEPFGSWFETTAATLRTTCGDLARALGLRVLAQARWEAHRGPFSWMTSSWPTWNGPQG